LFFREMGELRMRGRLVTVAAQSSGFLNWAFAGNFVRNGNNVTFSKPA